MALSNRQTLSLPIFLMLATAGCGGGSSGGTPSGPAGEIVQKLGTADYFVREKNKQGQGVTLNFSGDPVWGRLVDIEAIDPATGSERLYFRDYLIGADIETGIDYTLDRNPVSGNEVLTIEHPFGSDAFRTAFFRLEQGLQNFLDKGLGANELPPFTSMPRNAAMALRFDDLLLSSSVSAATVLIETGYPPKVPFQARIFPDPNHGDVVGNKFHSTRVIIDMSVSQAEAASSGISPNPIGLPEASDVNLANVVLRIPTILSASATQFELLENLSGHPISFGGNGSTLLSSPTLDVIRAFRSGGRNSNTGDLYNGFLRDETPPQVLGSLGVTVNVIAPLGGSDYSVDLAFNSLACALTPRAGDLIVLNGGVTAEVTQAGAPPGAFGTVTGVLCQLIGGSPLAFVPGAGQYRAPWDTGVGVVPECFVRFSPEPTTLPATGVSTDASVKIGFSEPMFPPSLSSFDGFVVQKGAGGATAFDNNVVAVVNPGLDFQDFTFDPLSEFDHDLGSQETYSVELLSRVTDLAGNALVDTLPRTNFSLSTIEPTVNSAGFAFTFSTPSSSTPTGPSSANVDDNGDTFPELRGQFIYDPLRGEIRPRSVDRFSGVIDNDRCSVTAMTTPGIPTITSGGGFIITPIGALEPLSPHGSRTMALWRYWDLGLKLFDESTYNIDVEGLHWAPFTQGLALDYFTEFSIGLAHGKFLPALEVDPATLVVQFPQSGLTSAFDSNLLDPAADPIEVVHERTQGYLVQPLDQFQAPSGTLLAPWPLNRNKPRSDFRYYTFRDTSIDATGGINSDGADPDLITVVGGDSVQPPLGCPEAYDFGNPPPPVPEVPDWMGGNAKFSGRAGAMIPSIALPLLMDFRNYPDSSAQGLNLMTYMLGTGQGIPAMRLHSTGAQLPNGNIVPVNPDNQVTASGSFDQTGAPTPGVDDGFYLGQADFVVRVNRVHTVWLDAGLPSTWSPALLQPSTLNQPQGTSVTIEYRGATQLNDTAGSVADANLYDPYGDAVGLGVTYVNGDSSWKPASEIGDLVGARYIQMRITMVSNAESGVVPVLSSLGISYSN